MTWPKSEERGATSVETKDARRGRRTGLRNDIPNGLTLKYLSTLVSEGSAQVR